MSFPEVLGKDYDSSWFEFKHTESERTRDSARAFAEGLFGSFGEFFTASGVIPVLHISILSSVNSDIL